MIEVKDLLNKFEHVLFSEENKRECVQKALREVVGIEVDIKKIEVRGGTAYLDLKPIYKNEIFLKQDLVRKKLGELLSGKNSPADFR